ncbi:hypothetical protein DSO57_1031250 [Entomophthora muscae]|uniref:Uncharacterized protein n=1 Tax=Entomophthora muscae TaxID=34485 RepID=A0ACC2TYM5_9FUNG|nr:hypothetical protein DSO57_1031250 [Entomophthora muscae]
MGFGGYTDRFTHTAQSIHKRMSTMLEDKDGTIASSILHWQVIARMNAKRKSEAADLVEEYVFTSRICRTAPNAIPGASPPCELTHLVPMYHKINPIIAFGVDVYSSFLILLACILFPLFLMARSLITKLTTSIKPTTAPKVKLS